MQKQTPKNIKTKMKTRIATLLIALTALTACSDASFEAHQSFFYPQKPEGMLLYADQTTDTTNVYSLDSWTATTEGDWFDINPKECTIPVGMAKLTHMTLTTTPNLSGMNRSGRMVVKSHDTISQLVCQCTWLNIIYPFANYTYEGEEESYATRKATFSQTLPFDAVKTEVRFNTYSSGATLRSDAEWLQPEETAFPEAGNYTVKVQVQPNAAKEKRVGRLTLSSAGVSSVITVEQLPKPEQ